MFELLCTLTVTSITTVYTLQGGPKRDGVLESNIIISINVVTFELFPKFKILLG